MATHLSLRAKILIPLFAMQVTFVVLGVLLMDSQLRESRLTTLDRYLDSQSDAIEDALNLSTGRPDLAMHGELLGELNRDRDFYFLLLAPDGRVLLESHGPSAEARAALHDGVIKMSTIGEEVKPLMIQQDEWHVTRQKITKRPTPEQPTLIVGLDVQPALQELGAVRRVMAGGGALFLLTTLIATSVIVTGTTSNLRRFAKSLRSVDPLRPSWAPSGRPASAEELDLYSSFGEMIDRVRLANEKQRLFIANASHELKTPIAGMLTALQATLARPRKAEEYERTLHDVLESVNVLRRLSRVLLDLSTVEARAMLHAATPLAALAAHLVARWRPVADTRDVKIHVEAGADTSEAMVRGGRELLDVALGNLIDNAIKYSYEGGQVDVQITSGAAPGELAIRVRDYGIGMTRADQERLGEMFFRADLSRSDELSFGLGFAHAKRIIESLGGRLAIVSRLGKGTAITVHLPVLQ